MWSELGHAYLEAGNVPDAIAAYLRSQDGSRYAQVGGLWFVGIPGIMSARG